MNDADIEARLVAALHRDRDTAPVPAAPTREQMYALASGSSPSGATKALRVRRTGWQRGLAAAAAVAVFAGGASILLTRDHAGGNDSRRDRPTSARQFLLASARIVTAAPFVAPQADQVDYARTVDVNFRTVRASDGRLMQRPDGLVTYEIWKPQTLTRPGLRRTDHQQDLRLGFQLPGEDRPPLDNYAGLSKLPTDDPERLLAILAANVGNALDRGDDTTVEAMKVLVRAGFFEQVLPPRLAAAVYTALSADPDMTEQAGATDILGRPAVAIGVTDSKGSRFEVLFNPRTHQPIGTREYVSADGPSPAGFRDGTAAYSSTAIVQVATVDRVGQNPGK